MLLTTHILVGGVLGQATKNLPLAFGIGFASHFLLDSLPHFDPGIWYSQGEDYQLTKREVIVIGLDVLTGLILILILWQKAVLDNYFILGLAGGASVDLIDNVPWWREWVRSHKLVSWISQLHHFFHFSKGSLVRKHQILFLVLQLLFIFVLFCYSVNQ